MGGGDAKPCAASIAMKVRRPAVPPVQQRKTQLARNSYNTRTWTSIGASATEAWLRDSARGLASSMRFQHDLSCLHLALAGCAAVLASALGCGARTFILDESLPESAAGSGSGPHEAGDDGGPSGCFRFDPGNSCAWFATDLSENPDACQTDGYEVGSCPASGLIGCCIEGVPGQPVTNAACAYEPKPGLSSASCGASPTFYWKDGAP